MQCVHDFLFDLVEYSCSDIFLTLQVAQPDSVIKALLFNSSTGPNDDFLLRLIAALEELSTESNVADVISQRGWNSGDFESNAKQYAQKGRAICLGMGIRIGSGKSRSVDNGEHFLDIIAIM